MNPTTLAEKLDALLATSLTYREIAERAGCDASTIFRIRSGTIINPSYSVGVAIDVMHAKLPRKQKTKNQAA